MRGLVIKSPYIEQILAGTKVWEVRSTSTSIRGTIALIKSKSGKIFGTVDVVGTKKISFEEYKNWKISRGSKPEEVVEMPYKNTHAWILENPVIFKEPISYKHPNGAVIWVKLNDEVIEKCYEMRG